MAFDFETDPVFAGLFDASTIDTNPVASANKFSFETDPVFAGLASAPVQPGVKKSTMLDGLADIILDGDYTLDINGKSKHIGTDAKYNEDNKGIGVTATRDGKFLTVGGYNNSFNEPSYYLGAGIKKRYGNNDFYIEPGLMGGVVTGYEDNITPMVLPMLSAGIRDYGALNLMYAPEVKDKNPATLMLNYSIPIK